MRAKVGNQVEVAGVRPSRFDCGTTVGPTPTPPNPAAICLSKSEGEVTVDFYGYVNNGDGSTTLTFGVTNPRQRRIDAVGFKAKSWQRLSPDDRSIYMGGLGTYNVRWITHSATPNQEAMRFKSKGNWFRRGAVDHFVITVTNFDPTKRITVWVEVGNRRLEVKARLSEHDCDRTPPPMPTPTATPSPTPSATPTQPGSPLPTPTATAIPTIAPELFNTARNYIAQQHNLPSDMLEVAAPYYATFPNLGRNYVNLAVVDRRGGGRTYRILIDPVTLEIGSDVGAIKRADEEAYIARYGKMDSALYRRLQVAEPDEEIAIAIWVNGSGGGQHTLFEQVAAQFPAAQAAFAQGKLPWDVDDTILTEQIRAQYRLLAQDHTAQRLAPLVNYLEQQYGIMVTPSTSMPTIAVTLTKTQIEELLNYPQVAMLHLAEGEAEEEQAGFSNGVDGAKIGATGPWKNALMVQASQLPF